MAAEELKYLENLETEEEKRLSNFRTKELISQVCWNLHFFISLRHLKVSMRTGQVVVKTRFRLWMTSVWQVC